MPLSNEIVPNLALSGKELAAIIVADVEARMASDGMFTAYVGYGRVSYEVEIRLHLDNFSYPEHLVKTYTRKSGKVEGQPPLVDPSEEAVELTLGRKRKIDSPNAARIEAGLPIKIAVRQDGRVEEKELRYARDSVPAAQVEDSLVMRKGGVEVDPGSVEPE